MPGMFGGGGGGGNPAGIALARPAAGPVRSLNRYQQYIPLMYENMVPGTIMPPLQPGGAIPSYIPSVAGTQGVGGSGLGLLNSLMQGYAGVPLGSQPTNAGMGYMTQPAPPPMPDMSDSRMGGPASRQGTTFYGYPGGYPG